MHEPVSLSQDDEDDWPLKFRASYESDLGEYHVVEATWCFQSEDGWLVMPRSWGEFAARSRLGLGRLHRGKDAPRMWRPCLYRYSEVFGIMRLGSQMELEYRAGIMLSMMSLKDEEQFRRVWLKAHDRATKLLHENLTPQQRLDWEATSMFYVRGELNKLYRIESGNGFAICDPITHEVLVSYCFHPDSWIPHEDVALATKLLLDLGKEGEEEALHCGRAWPKIKKGRDATVDELVAAALEVDLY